MAKTDESKALTTTNKNTAVAVPEDLRGLAGDGTEGIGSADIRPPRLALAQSGSPQAKKANEKYIQGLSEGDLFNDLTGAIYERPLEFVVIRYLGKRAMEFYTEEERKTNGGQVVKDRNVALDDPRCQPTFDREGKWVPPVADIYADYLVFLPKTTEVVTLTFKNKDLSRNGAATQLNSLMKYILNLDGVVLTRPPAWARTFRLDTASKAEGTHNWAVFTVKLVGVTPVDDRKVAAELYEQFKAATVVVADENPETQEPGTGKTDEDVPF